MNDLREKGISGLKTICVLVAIMWGVEALNTTLGHGLNRFGIFPRDIDTLAGIIAWPFLHGGLGHLVMNTTPLLFLGFFVSLRGPLVFFSSTLLIVVVGGIGVWIFGRAAFHIGASGLVFGYFGFLVAIA